MRSFIILLCLLAAAVAANAQQNYDVSLIPKELLPHASAVVRNEEMDIRVEDLESTIVHFKRAVTVFNKNGDHMARIDIGYDKSTVIRYVKGAVYNEFSKQTGKFSEGNFDDFSDWDGFSLFTDARFKRYFPSVTDYPYTVVYEYELRMKQTLEFPQWEPIPGYGVSVEKSSFNFTCPQSFDIRYKESSLQSKAAITNNKGTITYSWVAGNLKALKDEPFSPCYKKFIPIVRVSPQTFAYYGVKGSFNNWQQLGKWSYDKLLASRDQLPEETVAHVKELTKDISDPKLKAKKIYEYMQHKTHYVSVQVGIGGYQPFLASDVDKQNYGDCKALVNYTQALLKAAGIDSYYCVVDAGRDYKVGLLNDFASMDQGNHIILCLPFKNDTTWADCTSQTIPFGYLGDFTDDRNVLACTPEGGKLMHTPIYTAQANLVSRTADFVLNATGELSGSMTTTLKGTCYDDDDYIINEPRDEQYKAIQKAYPINNLEIDNLALKQDKSFDPVTTERLKLHARDYASLTGDKFFFMLNPANRTEAPPQVRNRQNEVYINRGYTDQDEVIYTIPAGYKSDKELLNFSVEKPFGKFSVSTTITGDKLIYKREFQLIDGTYSKDSYADLVDFYQQAVDADDYTVSLVKK